MSDKLSYKDSKRRLPKSISLDVYVHSTKVGVLSWLEGDQHRFKLDMLYGIAPSSPILSLSLKNAQGGFDHDFVRKSRLRLPPFFSNLLPEGSLREYLATKLGIDLNREFFLLNALSDDLPGAVWLAPSDSELDPHARSWIAEEVADDGDDVLHFSLAGVQLKFSALMNASGGLTIPTHGIGGSYIVKLPSTRFLDVPENEFSMMTLARESGITTADFQLVETDKIGGLPDLPEKFGKSLAVKRFDRDGNTRIHMEDLAQVFDLYPNQKYKKVSYGGIAGVFLAETGPEGLAEFIRRLTFSIIIGNADMHLKNWSMLYVQPNKPSVAPAYDLISTLSYIDDPSLALSIAGEKSMYKITMNEIKTMAGKSRLPERLVIKTVEETYIRTHDAWQKMKGDFPISKGIKNRIDAHISDLKILER